MIKIIIQVSFCIQIAHLLMQLTWPTPYTYKNDYKLKQFTT
jgi:hypothetical protein